MVGAGELVAKLDLDVTADASGKVRDFNGILFLSGAPALGASTPLGSKHSISGHDQLHTGLLTGSRGSFRELRALPPNAHTQCEMLFCELEAFMAGTYIRNLENPSTISGNRLA